MAVIYVYDNIYLNRIDSKVSLYNNAVGKKEGLVSFTKDKGASNHISKTGSKNTENVKVITLDSLKLEKKCRILKIDVEGFESDVISGAEVLLDSKFHRPEAIIIELKGNGKKFGFDEKIIHEKFTNLGYTPCVYHPTKRQLEVIEFSEKYPNIIYIENLKETQDYVSLSSEFKINSLKI